MPGFARPCLVCGRRVDGGASRCPEHEGQRYSLRMACYVCGGHSAKGYCPEHDPWAGDKTEAERLARQPWRAGYRHPSYRDGRKAAVARAVGHCEKCHRRADRLEVDHVVPLSTARSADDFPRLNAPENLAVLCLPCHRAKTARRPR